MGATKPVTDETFEAEVLQSTRTVWGFRTLPQALTWSSMRPAHTRL
jgi:hypothetical protein